MTGIATSGTHLPTYTGFPNNTHSEAFIAKLNADGIRQWGTYYGGSNGEWGHGISVDKLNNIYITGQTYSSDGIATTGAHQTVNGGGTPFKHDVFLAKFNSNGIRQWGTYFGGENYEYGYAISNDNFNNVIITGYTESEHKISTLGSHKQDYFKIVYEKDAFLAKFNTDGKLLWSTYYGGIKDEVGRAIKTDSDDNIYMAGYTASNTDTGISTVNGFQQNHAGGASDVFIVKFNKDGIRQWGTFFGGEGNESWCDLAIDDSNNVFLAGATTSTTGIATPGAFKTVNENGDVFIAKFKSNGERVWATYFGGKDVENCWSVTLVNNNFLYITGYTKSTSGIANVGTHQYNYKDNTDVFIAKFTTNGEKLWGTYYGDADIEQARGITSDTKGNIYITGFTFSQSGIATPGAHSSVIAGSQEVFIAKFDTFLPPYDVGINIIDAPSVNICEGLHMISAQFINHTKQLAIDSFRIGWMINNDLQEWKQWQGNVKSGDSTESIIIGGYDFKTGLNTIKVWSFLPNGQPDPFNVNDTLLLTVIVQPMPEADAGEDKFICKGASASIGANAITGNTYSWTSDPPGFISALAKPDVSPLVNTVYYLTVTTDASDCENADTVIVTVMPGPALSITGDTMVCGNSPTLFSAVTTTGMAYNWSVTSGNIISGQGTDSIVVQWENTSGSGEIKLSVQDTNGCETSSELKVGFYRSPLLDLGPDAFICERDSTLKEIDAGKEFITYRWHPTADTTHYIIVRKVGDYYVVVTDNCGNELKDEIRIASRCPVIVPVTEPVNIYVPSAFTPNANSLNDVFRPVGDNILKEGFSLSIYNRWGEKVFYSTDHNHGWDGNYLSNKATEGVYLWMLECMVKAGVNYSKINMSGTVQLLR